jgi:outer membrane lipoprotein-sorting protein
MLRKTLLGLGFALALATPAKAETVDELIAKNVAARGGLDKLKAVQSMRSTGKMTVGPGMEAPATFELKRPGKVRLDITVQGMTLSQAYDGQKGWVINPFQGNPNPEPMSPEDLKEAEQNADMDGPLVDYKAKGHQVELVGKEKVEGTDAYKLKVALKNGDTLYYYLDADSYLEIKIESKRTVRGTEQQGEQTIGDYKDVGGLLIAHALEMGEKGRPEKQKVTIEKIELNVPVDDSRFAMPAAKADAPAKPKA